MKKRTRKTLVDMAWSGAVFAAVVVLTIYLVVSLPSL